MKRLNVFVLGLAATAMGVLGAACSDDDSGNNQNQAPVCGNSLVETGEDCDGANLNGATCETLGMTGAGLACAANCTFNADACTGCGNGSIEMNEECDGADFGTQTCANLGFTGGVLGCSQTCTLNLSGCTGGCGNGVVEAGEDCDPPNGTTCDDTCHTIGTDECDEADSYDTDCSAATTGQWCWDGGDGGPLFCGCDPDWGDYDCQLEGYERCNPTTMRCEVPPDCGNDTNEGNDTPGTATSLAAGVAKTGAVCAYDEDWFTFTPSDTAVVILVTWTDDSETDLDIQVTDCADTTYSWSESSDPAQETATVSGLTAGTPVCIQVVHYSGAAGGSDVNYSITATNAHGCALDSQCDAGEVCPMTGSLAGTCQSTAPTPAGCGDAVAGDNDTSSLAESLTGGVPITEGTCDGHPTGPVDVDWFVFTLAAGERMVLTVNQDGALTDGHVNALLYDSNGVLWAAAASSANPEIITAAGLPAGTWYVMVYYYDSSSSSAGSANYTITLTLSSGTGCEGRDDCANLYRHGECSAGLCVPFEGGGAQSPGQFCDSPDDCDPTTTGSIYLSTPCFSADRNLGTDNVCVTDCTTENDCTTYGLHCLIVDDTGTPPGICIAPCTSDAGCGGATCDTQTGICSF